MASVRVPMQLAASFAVVGCNVALPGDLDRAGNRWTTASLHAAAAGRLRPDSMAIYTATGWTRK